MPQTISQSQKTNTSTLPHASRRHPPTSIQEYLQTRTRTRVAQTNSSSKPKTGEVQVQRVQQDRQNPRHVYPAPPHPPPSGPLPPLPSQAPAPASVPVPVPDVTQLRPFWLGSVITASPTEIDDKESSALPSSPTIPLSQVPYILKGTGCSPPATLRASRPKPPRLMIPVIPPSGELVYVLPPPAPPPAPAPAPVDSCTPGVGELEDIADELEDIVGEVIAALNSTFTSTSAPAPAPAQIVHPGQEKVGSKIPVPASCVAQGKNMKGVRAKPNMVKIPAPGVAQKATYSSKRDMAKTEVKGAVPMMKGKQQYPPKSRTSFREIDWDQVSLSEANMDEKEKSPLS